MGMLGGIRHLMTFGAAKLQSAPSDDDNPRYAAVYRVQGVEKRYFFDRKLRTFIETVEIGGHLAFKIWSTLDKLTAT